MGPITIYAASCGGSCSNFWATSARWFALDKRGLKPDGTFHTDEFINAGENRLVSRSQCGTADKFVNAGFTFTTRIPNNMAPGEYLIRMNIVALHSDTRPQFYPSCIQVRVRGNGNGRPADNELAGIWELDTGYRDVHIWNKPIRPFRVPGPDVAAFVNGGGSGGQAPRPPPPPSPTVAAPSSTNVGPTSTQVLGSVPTEGPKLCRRRKNRKPRRRNVPMVERALNMDYPVPRALETPLPLRVRHDRVSAMKRHHHELHH